MNTADGSYAYVVNAAVYHNLLKRVGVKVVQLHVVDYTRP